MKAGFVVIMLLASTSAASCSRILFVSCGNESHFSEFHGLGRFLLQRGHQVHVVLGERDGTLPAETMEAGYKVLTFKTNFSMVTVVKRQGDDGELIIGTRYSLLRTLSIALSDAINYCDDMLKDQSVVETVRSLRFDAVVIDAMPATRCTVLLAKAFGVANVVSLGTHIDQWRARMPFLPSVMDPKFTIGKLLGLVNYRDDRSVASRFANTFNNLLDCLFQSFEDYAVLRKNAEYTTLDDVYAQTISLHLLTVDYTLEWNPYPETPNVKTVGGISTRPAKPLKGIFREWADGAENGLVIFSFGSMLKRLTSDLRSRLLKAFVSMPQLRFLVKLDEEAAKESLREITNGHPETVKNVLISDYIPQNDALAHRNAKLMITHSGNNGQYEALAHGVPMIAMFVFADQIDNALRVAKRGLGIPLDMHSFTVPELVSAISQVLHTSNYTTRIKSASKLFNAQRHAGERAADYVELLIKFGPQYFHHPFGRKLNFVQLNNLDVNMILFAASGLFIYGFVRFACLPFQLARKFLWNQEAEL